MSAFKLVPVTTITGKQYKSNWLIKGVMEKNSIGMFFGTPASGKSLMAMDIAFCIAAGIDWNGYKTQQGNVIYIAGEGFNGLSKRFKALECKYKMTTSNLYLSEMPAFLSNPEGANAVYREICNTCKDATLIIIDTLHRNFGDGDENSSKDLGKLLYILSLLAKETGSTILLVHHSGHGTPNRSRGSSSIRAGMDFEFKFNKNDSIINMECTKAKEFADPSPVSFNIQTIPLPGWLDDEGRTIEAPILESSTYTPAKGAPQMKRKDLECLQSLKDGLANSGQQALPDHITDHPELKDREYLELDIWRNLTSKIFDDGKKKKDSIRQAFLRSRKILIQEKKVMVIDDCCYSLE